MVGIRRPAVVFAAVFLLSALMTGYGFSFICCIAAILFIPFLVFFGFVRSHRRKAFFILILIFSCSVEPLFLLYIFYPPNRYFILLEKYKIRYGGARAE